MHGLTFFNKGDSRHLLLDYSFLGSPMRRDFPTIGLIEVCYLPMMGFVSYKPLVGQGSSKVDYSFN